MKSGIQKLYQAIYGNDRFQELPQLHDQIEEDGEVYSLESAVEEALSSTKK